MNLLVRALEMYTPGFVKARALRQLFSSTAAAFEAEVPPLSGLDSQACLACYARFAQVQAGRRLREGRELEALEQRLYRNAFAMAEPYARVLRPRTVDDVMAICRVLYRILDIDLVGDARGDVVIQRCYFSRLYSGEVCRIMSAMDRGVFAGLSGGGELTFTSRITEGQSCCRAHFRWSPPEASI